MEYQFKNQNTAIKRFTQQFAFLGNFYLGKEFSYKGMKFNNAEAAFQSQEDPSREQEFVGLERDDAKKLGRKVTLRRDWEDIKEVVMYDVCKAKFSQDAELKSRLLATGDRELVEGNGHRDDEWGMIKTTYGGYSQWHGRNKLGVILMRIRSELRQEEE